LIKDRRLDGLIQISALPVRMFNRGLSGTGHTRHRG